MARGLCILLVIFILLPCGAGKVFAEPEQMQLQEILAESETDSAGQEVEFPLAEEIAETVGGESLESGQEESALKLTVGDHELQAAFADNSSAEAFRELLAQKLVHITPITFVIVT